MADTVFGPASFAQTRQWLQDIHAELEKKPREVFSRLNRDATVQVANHAAQFVNNAFEWSGGDAGQKIDDGQFRKAKCALYTYYKVLQGVLTEEQNASEAAVQAVVGNTNLLEALLLIAIELVFFAWHGDEGGLFPAATIHLERLHLAFDMWDAVGLFMRHLPAQLSDAATAAGSSCQDSAMPAAAAAYLGFMRVRITEELAFLNGSTLYGAMINGGGGSRTAGDMTLVADFVATAASMARERCFQVCTQLATAVPAVANIADFEEQVQALLQRTQASHYEVLFDQHQLNIVSCCVYAISRVWGATVPFKKINETITIAFPAQPLSLFTSADIGSSAGTVKLGTSRELYNEVFLPAMEDHLQDMAAACKPEAAEAKVAAAAPAKAPASKAHPDAKRSGAAAGPDGGRRHPFGQLSASDRNARRGTIG